jgi:two-component system NtrC family sensor kinase
MEDSMAISLHNSPPRMTAVSGTALAHVGAIAILLLLTAWALRFHFEMPAVPLIWAASAVALAAAFRVGNSATITVALAVAAVHLYRGTDPVSALVLATGTGLAGWLGACLLRHWHFSADFGRVHDVGVLLLAGCVVAAGIGALAATTIMTGGAAGFSETFLLCWVSETMGMLLFVPFLLTVRWPLARPDLETLGWLVGVPAVVYGIYAGGLPEMTALPASYAVFPLIMALALRRSVPVVSLVLLGVSVIAINCTALGKGPFVQADMRPNMLALHAHLAMLVLTGLLLAAIRSERSDAESRAREHLRMLARAGRISALSTMAAGIAHEINQPLCAVQSYAQTARRMAQRGAATDELDSVLERIVRSVDKAAAIVRRMRGFLRGEDASRERHDLNELVRGAVDLVRPECNRQRVELQVDLAASALPVQVDSVEVEQVVVNLVQNALDSLSRMPAEESRRWIRVATRAASAQGMDLFVSDSGRGLPEGDPAQLFEPLSGSEHGSGLGLAIVRSIVEAHGGEIRAGNADSGGAEFRVCLPAAEARDRNKRND